MAIVKVNNTGQGVNFDLSPEELTQGFWSSVRNIRFLNGYAQRFKGLTQVFAATTTAPNYLTFFQTTANRFWVHAGTNKVFADNGTTRTDITPTSAPTGGIDDRWTSTAFGGLLVATNGVDAPYFWNGNTSSVMAALPNWTSNQRCRVITSFKNYLVALDVTRAKYSATISTITFVTTTATLTTATPHNLSTGDSITVSGATPTQYNGTFTVTVTGTNTFTYTMGGTPASNATVVGSYVVNTTTRFPTLVKWSHAAVPGALPASWDETNVTLDAGENELGETPDAIVDALPLGDALVIYKERSMYLMRFVGQPFIFQFQRLPGEYGMLSRGCGAVTPLGHVVLTAGDVILANGQQTVSIADGIVRRFIFNNINTDNFRRAFVTTNPQRSEVVIAFPFDGSSYCTRAAVWNWETRTWGLREIPEVTYGATGLMNVTTSTTWATDSEAWNQDSTTWAENEYSPNESRLLLCNASKVMVFDLASTDDGLPLVGELERTGLHFDDPYSMKLCRAVYPRIDGPPGSKVTVQVGAARNPSDAVLWSAPVDFTIGTDLKVDTFATGRYLAVKFSSDTLYRMRSFEMDIVMAGVY